MLDFVSCPLLDVLVCSFNIQTSCTWLKFECVCGCVCAYLLQHHSLLLLEQGLKLLRGENLLLKDLLHLLRCDHLGTHHGHWHWNLDMEDERGGKRNWKFRERGRKEVNKESKDVKWMEGWKEQSWRKTITDVRQAYWCGSTGSMVIGDWEVGRAGLLWLWRLAA